MSGRDRAAGDRGTTDSRMTAGNRSTSGSGGGRIRRLLRLGLEPPERLDIRSRIRLRCAGLSPGQGGRRGYRLRGMVGHRADPMPGDTRHRRVVLCLTNGSANGRAKCRPTGPAGGWRTAWRGLGPGQVELGCLVGQSGKVCTAGIG
ncbi:MAG TPA: hypothetical protein VFZ32_17490 [Micromonosporaceae bacterium]